MVRYEGNPPVTGGFLSQKASGTELWYFLSGLANGPSFKLFPLALQLTFQSEEDAFIEAVTVDEIVPNVTENNNSHWCESIRRYM